MVNMLNAQSEGSQLNMLTFYSETKSPAYVHLRHHRQGNETRVQTTYNKRAMMAVHHSPEYH